MVTPEMVIESATTAFEKLELDSGVTIAPVECAYETYGTLNAARTNAILVLHAFSGDAHAAGEGGWWANMIGPGKAFDTDRYFVICSNVLGGCRGTSGPGSINPETGCPWAMTFPPVTISDMVRLQKLLIDHLIELFLVALIERKGGGGLFGNGADGGAALGGQVAECALLFVLVVGALLAQQVGNLGLVAIDHCLGNFFFTRADELDHRLLADGWGRGDGPRIDLVVELGNDRFDTGFNASGDTVN